MDYLRSIRKPPDMTPTAFMLQFRASEMRALHLPDAPNANGGFSDVDRRRLFYKAMPYSWQVKFDDANLTVEDETMADMLIYFDRVHANNPFIKDNGNEGGGGKGNGDNDNSKGNGGRGKGKRGNRGRNGNGNRNNNGNGSNSNNGSGSNSGDKRQGRIQNSDPCPLPGHGNHTWGECRSNRYNNDYQANRSSSGNGGNSGNGNRSNQGRNDSNAANQSNSADSSTQSNTQSNSSNASNNSSSHFFVDAFLSARNARTTQSLSSLLILSKRSSKNRSPMIPLQTFQLSYLCPKWIMCRLPWLFPRASMTRKVITCSRPCWIMAVPMCWSNALLCLRT